jgi:putative endonuclease
VGAVVRRLAIPFADNDARLGALAVDELTSPPVILGLDPRIQSQASPCMAGYVYIVTNHKRGTLYIGVTSNLERRIFEHREGLTPGFASKYGCDQLVWY